MEQKIIKSSGTHEIFNIKKIKKSLIKAGATKELSSQIIEKIKQKPQIKNTKDLAKYIIQYLQKINPAIGASYNLKYALMELGPAGYPFEKFVAEIYKSQGYNIREEKIIKGKCINHEVDFVAESKEKKIIAECKFHNRRGLKSDVKVTLYMKSRFDDINNAFKATTEKINMESLIVTNTNFTTEAIKYGTCVGIKLIDWKFPIGKSLPDIINKLSIHPITTLTSLNRKEKREFIKNGFVLCRQAEENRSLLKKLGLTNHKIKLIIKESQDLCQLHSI